MTVHIGPYDQLQQATAELLAWAQKNGVQWQASRRGGDEVWGGRFEHYLTDRHEEPDPHKWEVEIAFLTT